MAGTRPKRIKFLLKTLKKSPRGAELIRRADKKAKREGKSIFSIIVPGPHSHLDTTLVRHFSADNPLDVNYEFKSKVYIDHDLSLKDAVLDLAHELVHYLSKKPFNPYEQLGKKDAHDFVRDMIEGKGGEVEAFLMECAVMSDLYPEKLKDELPCRRVLQGRNYKEMYYRAKSMFYQLGKYRTSFSFELNKYYLDDAQFPEVSGEDEKFISSAYGTPYPLAALYEYGEMMRRVCINDRSRLEGIQDNSNSKAKRVLKVFKKQCAPYLSYQN